MIMKRAFIYSMETPFWKKYIKFPRGSSLAEVSKDIIGRKTQFGAFLGCLPKISLAAFPQAIHTVLCMLKKERKKEPTKERKEGKRKKGRKKKIAFRMISLKYFSHMTSKSCNSSWITP